VQGILKDAVLSDESMKKWFCVFTLGLCVVLDAVGSQSGFHDTTSYVCYDDELITGDEMED